MRPRAFVIPWRSRSASEGADPESMPERRGRARPFPPCGRRCPEGADEGCWTELGAEKRNVVSTLPASPRSSQHPSSGSAFGRSTFSRKGRRGAPRRLPVDDEAERSAHLAPIRSPHGCGGEVAPRSGDGEGDLAPAATRDLPPCGGDVGEADRGGRCAAGLSNRSRNALDVAPLWPAGHLPYEGGDRQLRGRRHALPRGQNRRLPHCRRKYLLVFSMPCTISPRPCAPILSPSAKTLVRFAAVPPMGTPVATVIAWGGTGASERSLTWRPSPGGRPGYLGGHYDPSVPIGTKTARRP